MAQRSSLSCRINDSLPESSRGAATVYRQFLPTREQELAHLDQLLAWIEQKACLYAPLRGIVDAQPSGQASALLAPWADDEDIALLQRRPRRRRSAIETPAREYDDILAAFDDVQQAALLGGPGAGKSTTLRRLAAVLARWLEAGFTEDAFWSVADPQDDKRTYAKTSFADPEIWRRHVPNPRGLLRLAANPLMLTMLYQVGAFEGELPRNRGDLFARLVDRLLKQTEDATLLEGNDEIRFRHQQRVGRDRFAAARRSSQYES